MAKITDVKVNQSTRRTVAPVDFKLTVTIPVDCVDEFSHGMLHDRISAQVGQQLQLILTERRAQLLSQRRENRLYKEI